MGIVEAVAWLNANAGVASWAQGVVTAGALAWFAHHLSREANLRREREAIAFMRLAEDLTQIDAALKDLESAARNRTVLAARPQVRKDFALAAQNVLNWAFDDLPSASAVRVLEEMRGAALFVARCVVSLTPPSLDQAQMWRSVVKRQLHLLRLEAAATPSPFKRMRRRGLAPAQGKEQTGEARKRSRRRYPLSY